MISRFGKLLANRRLLSMTALERSTSADAWVVTRWLYLIGDGSDGITLLVERDRLHHAPVAWPAT